MKLNGGGGSSERENVQGADQTLRIGICFQRRDVKVGSKKSVQIRVCKKSVGL